MHPTDCPQWEYSHHNNSQTVLKKATKAVLLNLRKGKIATLRSAVDTRYMHWFFFKDLTPDDGSYYAGHYRGEDYRCLKYNQVGVPSDPRVGFPPHLVLGSIRELGEIIKESVAALDEGIKKPNSQISLQQKIIYTVVVVCRIFEQFLRIHPYVNGNGHMGRLCMWLLLSRYQLWPVKWPIEPRPDDPPYTDLLVQHRNGDRDALERFIMRTLVY